LLAPTVQTKAAFCSFITIPRCSAACLTPLELQDVLVRSLLLTAKFRRSVDRQGISSRVWLTPTIYTMDMCMAMDTVFQAVLAGTDDPFESRVSSSRFDRFSIPRESFMSSDKN